MSKIVTKIFPYTPETFNSTFQTNVNAQFGNYYNSCPALLYQGGYLYAMQSDSSSPNKIWKIDPSTGNYDTTFNTNVGTGWDYKPNALAYHPTAGILCGTNSTSFNGSTVTRLIALNTNGTRNTGFTTSTIGSAVYALGVQSTGDVIVGGAFTTPKNRLFKTGSTGTTNATFSTNIGTAANNTVYAIAIQSDDKIIIGGAFTTFNGSTRNYLMRLNSDGTADTAFYTNLGTAFDSWVRGISIQADGKILVAGSFSTFNGNTRRGLVRLNSDGTEDTTFGSNFASSSTVAEIYKAIKVEADGGVVVFGNFSNLNGSSAQVLSKVNSSGTVISAYVTAISSNFINYNLSNASGADMVLNQSGRVFIGAQMFLDFNGGNYIYHLANFADDVTVTSSWTAPAGVTEIMLQPCNSSGNAISSPKIVTVTPNTTYTITINNSSFALNNANTFGALFSWTGSGYIQLQWVE